MDLIVKLELRTRRKLEAEHRKLVREGIQRQQKLKKMVDAIYHYSQQNSGDFMFDVDGMDAGLKKLTAIWDLGMMYETPAERAAREAAFNAMMAKI